MRPRHGGPPGRRHGPSAGPQRPLPPLRLARLLRAPLEPGHEDLRAGDHRPPQEVRREHPGRGLPSAAAVHRQRRGRRPRESVRVNSTRPVRSVACAHTPRTLVSAVRETTAARS